VWEYSAPDQDVFEELMGRDVREIDQHVTRQSYLKTPAWIACKYMGYDRFVEAPY